MDSIRIKDNFKYLVVDTGYTSRLIKSICDIEEEIKGELDYLCNNEDSCPHCQDYILYIYDKLWGGDNPYYYNVQRAQECEYVKNKINNQSGVIVLRCEHISNAFAFTEILMKQGYCNCFSLRSLMSIELKDDVLIIKFDCESG
jgi:hypothetical protein